MSLEEEERKLVSLFVSVRLGRQFIIRPKQWLLSLEARVSLARGSPWAADKASPRNTRCN